MKDAKAGRIRKSTTPRAPQPEDRILAEVESILKVAISRAEPGALAKPVLVNIRDFYRVCELTRMSRERFADTVGDILTVCHICKSFGTWIFAEAGDGFHIFANISRVGANPTIEGMIADGSVVLHAPISWSPKPRALPKPVDLDEDDDEDEDEDDDLSNPERIDPDAQIGGRNMPS